MKRELKKNKNQGFDIPGKKINQRRLLMFYIIIVCAELNYLYMRLRSGAVKVLMEFAGLYIASMVAFVGIIVVGVHVFKTKCK
ncbi:hypothetical protein [Clostridium ljungdahlii]|nr:hypothetical protein [Clostridium ljungdahlii]